jgi:hypothetical protein
MSTFLEFSLQNNALPFATRAFFVLSEIRSLSNSARREKIVTNTFGCSS